MKRAYYYSDELNDDFAGTKIRRKELPADYNYFPRNPVRNAFGFLLYRFIVTPLILLFQKIVYRETFKNRKVLRKYGKEGCFLYANHTSAVSDAFTPTLTAFPKKAYILVNPDAVSLPVAGKAVELLGGVPLPTNRHGMRAFHDAVLRHAEEKHCVVHLSRSAYLALLYENQALQGRLFPLSRGSGQTGVLFHHHLPKAQISEFSQNHDLRRRAFLSRQKSVRQGESEAPARRRISDDDRKEQAFHLRAQNLHQGVSRIGTYPLGANG